MTTPKLSDKQFMDAWRETPSVAAIAKRFNLNLRQVNRRRRALEAKYDMDLKAGANKIKIRNDPFFEYNFDNGCIIAFSDAHFWPGIYTTAFRAMIEFCKEYKPKVVSNGGDSLDGAGISDYPSINWEHIPSLKEEIEANKDCLGKIIASTPKSVFVWELGNHDQRFERTLANRVDEYKGLEGFHLKDHFPEWKPCWTFKTNHTVFTHRFKGGEHAAYNNAIRTGRSHVTGHDHLLYHRAFRDYNGIRYGIDTGMLADTDGPQFVDYTEANMTHWNSGFYLLTYKNGRLLSPEMIIVVDEGIVEFRGKKMEV